MKQDNKTPEIVNQTASGFANFVQDLIVFINNHEVGMSLVLSEKPSYGKELVYHQKELKSADKNLLINILLIEPAKKGGGNE